MTLERYRPLVGEWERFLAAHRSPEPVTLRVRSGRISTAALTDRLGRAGFRVEPVAGLDAYLRLAPGAGPVAQTVEHWLGLFHVQQAVMALPTLALGVSAGERVLDLCAAPGGKTTHLAELMGETGPLIAVEPKEKRIRGLLGNIYRLGYRNVIVVAGDGRTLPEGVSFDRVLVDAPCSGEGNYRRRAGRLPPRTAEFSRYVTRVQEALLRHAVRLTKPGGTIVYATCTYAPEENEAVVDRVLRDAPVTVAEIPLGLPHSPGLTAWAGHEIPRGPGEDVACLSAPDGFGRPVYGPAPPAGRWGSAAGRPGHRVGAGPGGLSRCGRRGGERPDPAGPERARGPVRIRPGTRGPDGLDRAREAHMEPVGRHLAGGRLAPPGDAARAGSSR